MNRIFGKTKEKAPPPDMTTVIKGVNNTIQFTFCVRRVNCVLGSFKGRRTCRIRGTENKQTRKRVEKIERPNGQDERRPSKEFVETKSFENFKTKETVSNMELSNINQTIYLIGHINLSVIFKVKLVPTKNCF